jgi:glycosyltransferase involved in cell wall biosynthesis
MKVLHVVAGLSPRGAGLSEAVPRLAAEAVRLGHEATIATVARRNDPLSKAAEDAEAAGVRIIRFAPSFPAAAYASWEMIAGAKPLRPWVANANVVHVHSDWTFPVWWASREAVRQGKPLVMSPRGCLDPVRLAHSAWKKTFVAPLDRRCLLAASAIHATSEAEREWVQAFLHAPPLAVRIEVIPNGVELPKTPPREGTRSMPQDRTRTVFALGRLHPLKGLDLLLDAWHELSVKRADLPGWRLLIAGPDEQGARSKLEEHARALKLGNVEFLGPVYGDEKARLFQSADIAVVPSRSESFGNVVAEALAAAMPVVTTTATPWAEIDGVCGWCVAPTEAALAQALWAAMKLSDHQRDELGERGRKLVEDKYTWARVGRAMQRLYEAVVSDAARKPDVAAAH